MKVYIEDMLVKSTCVKDHCQHLSEMFDILRKYGMNLNPRKYAFGVSSGKFLDYMVNNRGTEANPEKIQAIIDMKAPTKSNEMQSLTGKIPRSIRVEIYKSMQALLRRTTWKKKVFVDSGMPRCL